MSRALGQAGEPDLETAIARNQAACSALLMRLRAEPGNQRLADELHRLASEAVILGIRLAEHSAALREAAAAQYVRDAAYAAGIEAGQAMQRGSRRAPAHRRDAPALRRVKVLVPLAGAAAAAMEFLGQHHRAAVTAYAVAKGHLKAHARIAAATGLVATASATGATLAISTVQPAPYEIRAQPAQVSATPAAVPAVVALTAPGHAPPRSRQSRPPRPVVTIRPQPSPSPSRFPSPSPSPSAADVTGSVTLSAAVLAIAPGGSAELTITAPPDGGPVGWSLTVPPGITADLDSGTLQPGQSVTVLVTRDGARTGMIHVQPGGIPVRVTAP
jgi:hypothetical protein